MISRLGLRLTRLFRATAPDPFVLAILLTLLTAGLGLALGFPDEPGLVKKSLRLADSWSAGFWDLLKFSMQMCLILVTGHALASSRPVAGLLRALARRPRGNASAAGLVAFVACAAGLVNWGLGLIAGAVLAREVGAEARRRGLVVHYPLLAAAGYMGLLIFHGGLSGSAPLAMSTPENAKAVLRPEHLALIEGGAISLDQTLGSSLNLITTGGLLLGIPLLFMLMAPPGRACEPAPAERPSIIDEADASAAGRVPEWLDRAPAIVLPLAILLLVGVGRYLDRNGAARIGFDQINAIMLALGLALHGSARAYMRAAEVAASGCAGIIVQFPIYAGIMAMMSASGLTALIARGIAGLATPDTLPALTFLAATLVGLLVPSGGAQWSVQGPIALASGADMGVAPGAMVMAVAYGDELANMLQPFWALPLLAITGVKARDIVGYTAIVMAAAGLWITLCLLLL